MLELTTYLTETFIVQSLLLEILNRYPLHQTPSNIFDASPNIFIYDELTLRVPYKTLKTDISVLVEAAHQSQLRFLNYE